MDRTLSDITWEDYIATTQTTPQMKELTNILCPVCQRRIYKNLGVVLTTYPPQYRYECECGWSGISF